MRYEWFVVKHDKDGKVSSVSPLAMTKGEAQQLCDQAKIYPGNNNYTFNVVHHNDLPT